MIHQKTVRKINTRANMLESNKRERSADRMDRLIFWLCVLVIAFYVMWVR